MPSTDAIAIMIIIDMIHAAGTYVRDCEVKSFKNG